jgi:hypothetical protein
VSGLRRTQQGIAMMLFAAIAVLIAASLVLRAVNAASWRSDRHRVTNEAFAKAKEALVARAVMDDNRPGSLPCPDTDNDGAAQLFAGNQCPSYLGRLPWRTLDLPDLRDADGERLWYALSRTHRDHGAAEPINSDTIGELAVNGAAPSTQALAILLSPGAALQRAGAASTQLRDCPANCNAASNYLDSAGGFDNAVWSVVGGVVNFVSAPQSDSFNDRLVPILPDDIMPLVEKRAAREIALAMKSRYEAWQSAAGRGFYPWPAPFNDPANPGIGVSGTLHGHLPMTTTPAVWTFANVAGLGSCNGVGTTTLTCSAVLLLGNVTARLDNVATRFLEAPTPPQSGGLALASNYSYTLNTGAQRMDFQYSALLGISSITIEAPVLASWAPAGSPWLVNNQWNRVATYAISQGHAITGPGACTGPSPCISIGGPADKEAIVMMAGRPLPATLPTQTVADRAVVPAQVAQYLEAANTTPADMALERNLRTTVFNDQPVVVRP